MSYEIVKNIRIDDKTKKVYVTSCSNNVTPKRYYSREVARIETDFTRKKETLFNNIIDGYFNIDKCRSSDYTKSFDLFLEHINKFNVSKYDLWDYGRFSTELNKCYEIFNTIYEQVKKDNIIPNLSKYDQFLSSLNKNKQLNDIGL